MRHYCCKKIKVKVMGLTVMLLSYSTSFGGGFRLRACVSVCEGMLLLFFEQTMTPILDIWSTQ